MYLGRRGNAAWLLVGTLMVSTLGTVAMLQGTAKMQNGAMERVSTDLEKNYASDMATLSAYFKGSCNPFQEAFNEAPSDEAKKLRSIAMLGAQSKISMSRDSGKSLYCSDDEKGTRRCLKGITPPAPSSLDATFGSAGIAAVPGMPQIINIALRPNGSILVFGSVGLVLPGEVRPGCRNITSRSIVARLTPAGALDNSFGVGGYLIQDPPCHREMISHSSAVFSDANRVVRHTTMTGGGTESGLTVFTFDPALPGEPEPLIGSPQYTGPITLPGLSTTPVMQADGKPVFSSLVQAAPGSPLWHPRLTRLNPDFTPDLTFGGGAGYTQSPVPIPPPAFVWGGPRLNVVAALVGGGFVMLTNSSARNSPDPFSATAEDSRMYLAFFNADGSDRYAGPVQVQFGETPGRDQANLMQVNPDGKILIGGTHTIGSYSRPNAQPAWLRLQPNGMYDNSFSDDGREIMKDPCNLAAAPQVFYTDINGSIYFAGPESQQNGNSVYGIGKLLDNGKPDPAFGLHNGLKVIPLEAGMANTNGHAYSALGFPMEMQPDGKIIGLARRGGLNVIARLRIE